MNINRTIIVKHDMMFMFYKYYIKVHGSEIDIEYHEIPTPNRFINYLSSNDYVIHKVFSCKNSKNSKNIFTNDNEFCKFEKILDTCEQYVHWHCIRKHCYLSDIEYIINKLIKLSRRF
jgi:hypothetical protein